MKILFIFGTRPEAIKMSPLVNQLRKDLFHVEICVTGQHREMLDQVMNFFNLRSDYDCNLMRPNQNLFDITINGLKELSDVFIKSKPDITIVQGDTTTAFIGALASFYTKTKIAHIEAGLRSYIKMSPFPEELNRSLIGRIADYHFAPTPKAVSNLHSEGIFENVWNVGNTVIDALILGLRLLKEKNLNYEQEFKQIDFSKKIVLVTCHRRENFGEPFRNICSALNDLSTSFQQIQFVYPVHPNPNIIKPAYQYLDKIHNLHLIKPLAYQQLIWFMEKSTLILTDSGGIQEEAPSLKKPLLVLRDVTERTEGIEAGNAILVGTSKENIICETSKLLTDPKLYKKMTDSTNPYGDGTACIKISKILNNLTNGFSVT